MTVDTFRHQNMHTLGSLVPQADICMYANIPYRDSQGMDCFAQVMGFSIRI